MPESKSICPRPPTFDIGHFKHLLLLFIFLIQAELDFLNCSIFYSGIIFKSLLTSVHNVNSRHTIGKQFLILVRFHMPPIN